MAFLVDDAFSFLRRAHDSGRLAHAYLFSGPPGSGKRELALRVIEMTNGQRAESLTAHRDPGFRLVRPESKSRRIRVEQIRELERGFHLSAGSAPFKIGVVDEADRLQPEAENAFLKTLEEPPQRVLLILITEHPQQLLDTLLSRCIKVPLHAPDAGILRPSADQRQLLDAVRDAAAGDGRSLAVALGVMRLFSQLLKQTRETVAKENEAAFKEEASRYGQTTEGDWLKRREDYYKAAAESEYLRRRTGFLDVLVAFFGDALRQQQGYGRVDLAEYREATGLVGGRLGLEELLRRVKALEMMGDQLETNAQEQLVLEVGFIKAFG